MLPLFYQNDLEYRLWFMFAIFCSFGLFFFCIMKKKQTIYDKFLPVATHAAHCIYQVSKTWGFNKTQEISYSELVFYTESAAMASNYKPTYHNTAAYLIRILNRAKRQECVVFTWKKRR